MINGLKITKLEKRGNEKGDVFNLDLHGFDTKEIPIFYREKGIMGPLHFHEGWDKSNDPQIVIVLKGKKKINCEDIDGNKETVILEEGEVLEIPKMVLHDYEILEETIFVELRKDKYDVDNPDKFFEADFRKLQNKNT